MVEEKKLSKAIPSVKRKSFATAICLNCGNYFDMTMKSQKFCCLKCNTAYKVKQIINKRKENHKVVKCDYCGREFMQKSPRDKRCSKECRIEGFKKYRRDRYGDITKCKYCNKPRLPGSGRATCGSEECKKKHHTKLVEKRNKALKEGTHIAKKDRDDLNAFRVLMGLRPIEEGKNFCLMCGKQFLTPDKRNNHICPLCTENPERHTMSGEDTGEDTYSYYSTSDPSSMEDIIAYAEV